MLPTRELFDRHRLRCTRQRVALYEGLRQCKSHPTAEQLFQLVAPQTGGMSRATVYNTLEKLCSTGLARRIPMANGCCRFDADSSDHLHVRMTGTSEILDVPEELGERLCRNLPKDVLAEIERQMGVNIEGIGIQLTASPKPAA